MRIDKNDIPTRIDAPGAVARQSPGFGETGGKLGTMGAEYFSMAAGADLAPLLEGLDHVVQAVTGHRGGRLGEPGEPTSRTALRAEESGSRRPERAPTAK